MILLCAIFVQVTLSTTINFLLVSIQRERCALSTSVVVRVPHSHHGTWYNFVCLFFGFFDFSPRGHRSVLEREEMTVITFPGRLPPSPT